MKSNQSKVKTENQSGLTLLWYWDNLYSWFRPGPQNCLFTLSKQWNIA